MCALQQWLLQLTGVPHASAAVIGFKELVAHADLSTVLHHEN